MPCHSAAVQNLLTFSVDTPVEEALAAMKEKNCRSAPVLDKDGKVIGVFSVRILLKNLLPVSVAVQDGLYLDTTVAAAPGVAKRLRKIETLTVGEIMERKFVSVYPETPVWEAVNLIVQHGAPVMVEDQESGCLLGLISEQSLLDELQRMQDAS
jgi:CBS domain-containing protein